MEDEQAPGSPKRTFVWVILILLAIVIIGVAVYAALARQGMVPNILRHQTMTRPEPGTPVGIQQTPPPDEPADFIHFKLQPFYYVRQLGYTGSEIHEVHPETREDTVIYSNPDSFFTLYAVPRVGFDGRIYLNRIIPDSTAPREFQMEFNVMSREDPHDISFSQSLPLRTEATKLSPDETKIAAVYDTGARAKQLIVWNLLTEESTVLGTIENNEQFAAHVDQENPSNNTGYALEWVCPDCIKTAVYKIYESDDTSDGFKLFCLPSNNACQITIRCELGENIYTAKTPYSFCYPLAYGAVREQESKVDIDAKTGTRFHIHFEKNDDLLFTYQTINFELTGDHDSGELIDFSCIDFSKSNEELKQCFPLADPVLRLERLKIADTQGMNVMMRVHDIEGNTHDVYLYVMPAGGIIPFNAFLQYNISSQNAAVRMIESLEYL